MSKEYRVYYDTGLKRFGLCGNERRDYEDETPIMVTESLLIAEAVQKQLNRETGVKE